MKCDNSTKNISAKELWNAGIPAYQGNSAQRHSKISKNTGGHADHNFSVSPPSYLLSGCMVPTRPRTGSAANLLFMLELDFQFPMDILDFQKIKTKTKTETTTKNSKNNSKRDIKNHKFAMDTFILNKK